MTNIDALLGTLLLRNNCVVLPHFGGFIAQNVSSKIDVSKGIITPPSKALSFNKNLSNNDGLIVSTLSIEKNISYDEAQKIIASDVQKMNAQLQNGQRVHLENVGFLYTNSAGKIAFEQDRFFNLLLSSYGMGNVQFVSHEVEEKVEKKKEIAVPTERKVHQLPVEPKAKAPEKKVKKTAVQPEPETVHPAATEERKSIDILKKVVKYAAVAALAPLVFYSFWIPMKTDVLQSGVIYTEDFNPFNKGETENYKKSVVQQDLSVDSVFIDEDLSSITASMNSSARYFSYPLDEDLFITVKRKDWNNNVKATSNDDSVNAKNEVSSKPKSGSKGYYAIVGCFSVSKNADDLVDKLINQGFDASIVDVKGGLHRVAAGKTNRKRNITSIRQKLTSINLPSWVLKK